MPVRERDLTKEFDKIARSDFERAQHGPKRVEGRMPGIQNRQERF
jgi:hypothetical protein